MPITYRDLLTYLSTLSSDQLDQDVTVYELSISEYEPVTRTLEVTGDDALDDGSIVLVIHDA